MNKPLMLAILAVIAIWITCDAADGHGGQYRGPSDGSPNLGAPPPPDSGSGSSSGTSAPSTPSPATPGLSTGGGRVRVRGGSGMQRKRYSASMGFERWEFWWEYNKDSYLDLKDKIYGSDNVVGTASFLVGKSRKGTFGTSKRVTPEIFSKEVLPTLLEALEIDHPDVQDSSILAIARTARPEDAPALMEHITSMLSSKYRSAQESACLSLGVLGSKDAVAICRDLMFDTETGRALVDRGKVPQRVRAFAALSLGLIGTDEGVPSLMLVIDRESQMTQKDLIACAITALGLMGQSGVRDDITAFLLKQLDRDDLDPYIKSFIPVALGRIGDPISLAPIMRAFKDENRHNCVRQSCAIALGRLASLSGDAEVVGLLMKYIQKGKDVQTRHFAFIALAQVGARDDDFNSHSQEHERLAKFFRSEIEKPSRPSHLSWACLAAAIHAMAQPPLQAGVVEILTGRYASIKNPSDRGAMAVSLGLLDADTSAAMLFEDLRESRDKALQGYLCVGLGLMKWTAAAEKVRELVSTESVFLLRLQAAVGLGLMGDARAVDDLVGILEEGQTLSITSSVARALGQIGDRSAIEPLKEILSDPKAGNLSKAFVIVSLGLIGEKTDLPWNTAISENGNYRARFDAIAEVLDIL